MIDADVTRKDQRIAEVRAAAAERARRMELKMQELVEFRDAGVLTEAELEEQKAKVRWSVD